MPATPAVLIGNVATVPELKHTEDGTPYARLRVACNERWRNSAGEWVEREPVFWPCDVWGPDAEVVARLATRGAPVIVTGTFRSQTWTTDAGETRTRTYVHVQNFGVNALLAARRPARDGDAPPVAPTPAATAPTTATATTTGEPDAEPTGDPAVAEPEQATLDEPTWSEQS